MQTSSIPAGESELIHCGVTIKKGLTTEEMEAMVKEEVSTEEHIESPPGLWACLSWLPKSS
jgi:hypothetical protein